MRVGEALRGLPIVSRSVVVGLFSFGAVGCVVGLVLGLRAHWQTAWFAVAEVGAPAALLGAAIGLIVGWTARGVSSS